MKLLREYIRSLLTEAAMGTKDLEAIDGAMITITDWGSSANVQYYDASETSGYNDGRLSSHVPSGRVAIGEIIDPEMWGNGPCGGAWQVQEANADHGWGPLLYDVAIEFATMRANGLVPDRREVSMAARNVWRYYFSNRSDVKSHQLDNLKNQLTKTEKDNCNQEEAGYKYGDEEYMTSKAKWWKSPLSKRYTKTPRVINRLRKLGRIEIGKV